MSDAQRPSGFTVSYRGGQAVFTLRADGQGYLYTKSNGLTRWIETASGARHKLSFDEQGRATVIGSLGSDDNDGFHTVIENGVMRDV